jgi:periplasmic divalent cation tolerance protein
LAEQPVLILVTTGGRDDAERLGEALVVERLAASCSVVPTVASFYYWDDQLQRQHEALLVVKTLESRSAEVHEYVRAHHSYELPEILQISIDSASAPYLSWMEKQVAKPAR